MRVMIATRSTNAALLCFLMVPAQAQDQPASVIHARIAYEAAYYAPFKPSTALDMIRQTPGFVLEETNDRRGFAGASGNVLVDGERPIAKSQTLSDILQRIPATQVKMIEILRGGEAGTDASSHAVIANVIRTPSAGQGAYQLGLEYAGRTPVPNGWTAWSGRFGQTDYSIGTNGYSLLRNLPGERELLDGDSQIVGTKIDTSPRGYWEFATNGEAGRPMLGGQVRLTGQVQFSRYHEDSTIETNSAAGDRISLDINPYTERKNSYEVGLNHDRSLGAWDLSLSTLVTRRHFGSDIQSTRLGEAGNVSSIFFQDVDRGSGETVLRSTVSRAVGANHQFEAGVEGAINTLDQQLELALDLGNGPFIIPVPNSNLRIVERRVEANFIHNWTPGRWSVETKLAGEASQLTFTGDTNQTVRLSYLKPSLQISRQMGRQNQLRARLYRDVAQLDFSDFVSVVSVTDDRINGGNPDLKPETSWRAELAGDFRFAGDGALDLTLFHYWVSDTADLVPVGPPGARIDAPGNIGDASINGLKATLRLPLKALLPGASLTIDGEWQRSRVTDPLTGEKRSISGFEDVALKADFRHDLPAHKLAWGASYTAKPTLTYYRLREIERTRESPSFDVWLESTALKVLKLRLTLLSLLNQSQRRERIFYAPDRNGVVDGLERGERHPGRWLTFSVSGSL